MLHSSVLRSSVFPLRPSSSHLPTRDMDIWEFSNYKSYSDLPIIRIVDNPFLLEGPTSYGLICIAKETQTCLMVRRKHSIGLLSILKGFYKREDIPEYVSRMNLEERKYILRCLTSVEEFRVVAIEINGYINKAYEKDSYEYLLSCRELIHRSLELYSDKIPELDYSWPKGLKNVHEIGFIAAIRELLEESGVNSLDVRFVISDETVSCPIASNLGYMYNSIYWVCVLDSEFKIPNVNENEIEVSERDWIPISDIEKHLHPLSHPTWKSAFLIYNKILNLPSP